MKECMFDLCAETEGHLDTVQLAISVETLCDHYKYYADKCLTEGVLISWEKETLCRKEYSVLIIRSCFSPKLCLQ